MVTKAHRLETLDDDVLISRLLEHDDQLIEDEIVAFRNMATKDGPLSVVQREWAEKVYGRNGLTKQYATGKQYKKKSKPLPDFWWEKKENRPLRPPGR